MNSNDRLAFMRNDVPISGLVVCLRMVLGVPPKSETSADERVLEGHRPRSIMIDLEGWLAFVVLALPMFSGELPPAMEAALPYARRMLLAMGMQHSGDHGAETQRMLDSSRRELRRLLEIGGMSADLEELFECDRLTPHP